MIQQGREWRKAVPDGVEVMAHPSTVMQFPFQLLLQGCPQGEGGNHPPDPGHPSPGHLMWLSLLRGETVWPALCPHSSHRAPQ